MRPPVEKSGDAVLPRPRPTTPLVFVCVYNCLITLIQCLSVRMHMYHLRKRFPGMAISNAKIQIYFFSNKILLFRLTAF